MKFFVVAAALCSAWLSTPRVEMEEWYDFRATQQYADLTVEERASLEGVQRDFVLLWGALDLYVRGNRGRSPERLELLVPRYLKELPRDPFATPLTRAEGDLHGSKPSLDGWGYRYRQGIDDTFVISSVGLRQFPYLAAKGNVGLYIARGDWISGVQPQSWK